MSLKRLINNKVLWSLPHKAVFRDIITTSCSFLAAIWLDRALFMGQWPGLHQSCLWSSQVIRVFDGRGLHKQRLSSTITTQYFQSSSCRIALAEPSQWVRHGHPIYARLFARSPNVDQRWKIRWLRPQMFVGRSTMTFSVKLNLECQIFIMPILTTRVNTIATRENT